MFRRPKIEPQGQTPDPADVANRRDTERRKRLATGGSQSTMLGRAVQRAATSSSTTLTGVGG